MKLPISVTIVSAGDGRAANVESADPLTNARSKNGPKILEIDPELAPRIRETVPNPVQIPADGQLRKVVFKGANLSRITEIRVRKANRATATSQSRIHFEYNMGEISLELMATPGTPLGKTYTLDFIMGSYIAISEPFEIVDANAPQSPSPTPLPTMPPVNP